MCLAGSCGQDCSHSLSYNSMLLLLPVSTITSYQGNPLLSREDYCQYIPCHRYPPCALQEAGRQAGHSGQEGHRGGGGCSAAAGHHPLAQGPGQHPLWHWFSAVLSHHGLGAHQVGAYPGIHQGLHSHPQVQWLPGGVLCVHIAPNIAWKEGLVDWAWGLEGPGRGGEGDKFAAHEGLCSQPHVQWPPEYGCALLWL